MAKRKSQDRKQYQHTALEELGFDLELPLDDGERSLPIKLDEETLQKAEDYADLLIAARGIKTEIGNNDPEAVKIARRKMTSQKTRKLNQDDVQAIVASVRNANARPERIARESALLLAVLDSCDVLFDISERASGDISISMLAPYEDVEIPADYFKPAEREGTALAKLMEKTGHTPSRPKVDKDNPIEIILALAVGLLQQNPDFNEKLVPYLERAAVAQQFAGARFDDQAAERFRELVDQILFAEMDEPDTDEQRADVGSGDQSTEQPA